ncbi:UDP-N-acetylglucosamine 2-epimerase (non-hydrolyzing) [Paenibacillus nanensis]|uniref:UDP-N-acetylglucosamine 2-epimerase (Non-hydrolyzing) n=1 Tax=Paenibacillus nanensis TaxID=393251 RepID=A0A3A1V484_9BACL|nr:UDP-N-acetylglucosamine 2-epimerase (non-hydrolyzing) [Paenibacillus nanensis]RIX52340.1 UDP-N-acetylglucosamine 2-epimerase (non-hydrolyzing) [Paenibacillus nanensis]
MKIMTVLGTRPEIIRLSRIIPKLDQLASKHILVHTGQNKQPYLNDIFFEQLKLRKPDYTIGLQSHSFGQQVGQLFADLEAIMRLEQPDRLLILGDTNSALCAVLSERIGIPVYHMEAGNRCYDLRVPEELNRKVIDTVSSFNLPYTKGARDNLLREGIPATRIWVSGNPIYEVIEHYREQIGESDILSQLQLKPNNYVLVTAHRAENVDREQNLRNIIQGLHNIADELQIPVVCSVHPRTKAKLEAFGVDSAHPLLQLHEPFGFFEFIKLQSEARCVVTDSGTVQEESCILGVPAVIIRRSTERPETILCGSGVVSDTQPDRIAECVKLMMNTRHSWQCPEGYTDPDVSTKVVNMVLGGLHHV